jgi:hypothetical protein
VPLEFFPGHLSHILSLFEEEGTRLAEDSCQGVLAMRHFDYRGSQGFLAMAVLRSLGVLGEDRLDLIKI